MAFEHRLRAFFCAVLIAAAAGFTVEKHQIVLDHADKTDRAGPPGQFVLRHPTRLTRRPDPPA